VALDRELWGPEPSDAELQAAAAIGRQAAVEARRSLPDNWDRGSDGRPLPHLDDARRGYPGSELSFAVWLSTPNVDLDGSTPAAALAAGRHAAVVEAATALRLDYA
jgi:hypothetical protein